MPIENKFAVPIARLQQVLGVKADSQLAKLLGMKPTAFSERKRRRALPQEEIAALCEREGVNLEWVLTGEGQPRTDSTFDQLVRLQAAAHTVLEPLALDPIDQSNAAKLLIAIQTPDPLRAKELLRPLRQVNDATELEVLTWFRAASPEFRQLLLIWAREAADTARSGRSRYAAPSNPPDNRPVSPIPDPETARLKPAEARRRAAAKQSKSGQKTSAK